LSLSDVTGLLSRYFVVGFFAPAFFGLLALTLLATSDFYPSWLEPQTETGLLFVGSLAVLVGLLLEGLNYPLIRLFEGYPLLSRRSRRIADWLKARQLTVYNELATTKALAQSATTTEDEYASGALAWSRLDTTFPRAQDILPTRFGNVVRAFENYAHDRWGLDAIPVWPRIEALLSEQERDLHVAAKTYVAFFLNCIVVASLVGAALIADAVVNQPLSSLWLWLYVVPFLLALLFYRFAVDAAARWGSEVRSSIDLHRLELYERLGLRPPHDIDDERSNIAPAVTNLLLYGIAPPTTVWRGAPPGNT
jgi:hypothetical protein